MKKWKKKLLICGGIGLVTGGLGYAFAPAIAAAMGSTGILGCASTGAKISSLTGIALENASLAAIGGGAKSAGGYGMAMGAKVISGASGAVGGGGAKKVLD